MQEITLPASSEHFQAFKHFLESYLPLEFLSVRGKILLAVEELLMNVFHHAYGKRGRGRARIQVGMIDLDGDPYFHVSIQDWGKPYNPFVHAPKPNLNACLKDRPLGGLGVHLVKQLVIHYRYSRREDETGRPINDVELYFALPKDEKTP